MSCGLWNFSSTGEPSSLYRTPVLTIADELKKKTLHVAYNLVFLHVKKTRWLGLGRNMPYEQRYKSPCREYFCCVGHVPNTDVALVNVCCTELMVPLDHFQESVCTPQCGDKAKYPRSCARVRQHAKTKCAIGYHRVYFKHHLLYTKSYGTSRGTMRHDKTPQSCTLDQKKESQVPKKLFFS